ALPSTAVSPDTVMFNAIPETTWLPWCVMHAKPCTSASATEAASAAIRPSHAEPVTAATEAAANAAPSILPSSPMSTMPERSANSPPSAASTSGVAPRTVAAARSAVRRRDSLILGASRASRASHPLHQRGHRPAQRVLERAAHEDDQPLDHH